MLQFFLQSRHFSLYLHFPTTITDISHIPSTITLTKLYLGTKLAEAFKPYYIGTHIFFLISSFAIIGLNQSKYQFGLVNIS